MKRDVLEIELKMLVLQAIKEGVDPTDAMKDYVKSRYYDSDSTVDINVEHLDIGYNQVGDETIILIYGNLYTFVLCQCIYVPYYEWIYEDKYENEDYIFSRRIFTEYTDGDKCSSYSMKEKKTNKITTYEGTVVERAKIVGQATKGPKK